MSGSVRPVEQIHLAIEPGFGQHYFHRVDRPDYIVTSPNTSYLPPPPPPNERSNPRNYTVHWRYPRFIPDDMPHLAYIHRQPVLCGPLFARLDVESAQLPIDRTTDGRHILRSDVIKSWRRLEVALYGIQDKLLKPSCTNELSKVFFGDMPYQCGYLQPHKTEDDARYCAIKSRDAFQVLGALVSFAISFYRTGNQSKEIIPPWHRVLMPNKYDREWLELLEGTFICDFSRGARVGGYIQANSTRLFPQLRALLDSNVPVWVEWHLPANLVSNLKYGLAFQPRERHTERAIQLAHTNSHDPIYGSEPVKEWAAPEDDSFYKGRDVPYDEPFDDDSGPMLENYKDADDDSDYDLQGDAMDEDSDFEQPSSSRAVSRSRPNPPTTSQRRSPSPFLSAPRPSPPAAPAPGTQPATSMPVVHAGSGQAAGESHTQFFDRRRAERTEAARKESVTEFARRRYFEVNASKGLRDRKAPVFIWKVEGGTWLRNVVDKKHVNTVWAQFPLHTKEYSYDHQEWDICPFVDTSDDSNAVSYQPSQGSAPERHLSCSDDLDAAYDTRNTAKSSRMYTRDLKRLLAGRYGFTVPDQYVCVPPVGSRQHVLGHGEGSRAKQRIHGRSTDNFLNDEAVRAMWNSVILNDVCSRLPHTFDISPHASLGVSLAHDVFKLVIVPSPADKTTKICVLGVNYEEPSKQWFLLAFRNFATVLQIYRESGWSKGIMNVGRELMARGIPFNTVRVRKERPVGVDRKCQGLGHRQIGFVPKLRDYAHYEAQRSKLLREHDGLYARVALKMGGLYWRLAIEDSHEDLKPLVKKAMKYGPSSRPVAQVVAQAKASEFLVDDVLSPAAAAVLSGVYVVDTAINRQVEHISWWPKEEIWYKSELNVGYWSEACEDWYQGRLNDIRAGKATMLNSTGWRDQIRGGSTVTFQKQFNILAEDFVQQRVYAVERRW